MRGQFFVFDFIGDDGLKYNYKSNLNGVLIVTDADAAQMGFKPRLMPESLDPVRRLPRGGVMFSVHHMPADRVLTADDGRRWRLVIKTITPR